MGQNGTGKPNIIEGTNIYAGYIVDGGFFTEAHQQMLCNLLASRDTHTWQGHHAGRPQPSSRCSVVGKRKWVLLPMRTLVDTYMYMWALRGSPFDGCDTVTEWRSEWVSCTPVLYTYSSLVLCRYVYVTEGTPETDRQPVESGVDYEGMRTCPESSRRKRLVGSGRYPCPSVPLSQFHSLPLLWVEMWRYNRRMRVCVCVSLYPNDNKWNPEGPRVLGQVMPVGLDSLFGYT